MDDDKIEMLTQPLLTAEGLVNPACMNELENAILQIPPIHERCADDPEWQLKAWVGCGEICGQFARWVIVQACGCPPELHLVVNYLMACIDRDSRFQSWGDDIGKFAELTLCDVGLLLHETLESMTIFTAWDMPDVMGPLGLQWIDIDALFGNVCIGIRNTRRHDHAFRTKFDRDHPDE